MQEKSIFSVTQINEYIKMTLETNAVLRSVFLRGEISNFKSNYSSGHMYFSLKDDTSSLRAVMFRSSASRLKFMPEVGMKVVVHGKISTYTVSGDCQIIIDDMQPDGIGQMAAAFEQLKKKLTAEGLFDVSRKKKIPLFPNKVGVITSASGAALHDIINVSGRRSPGTEIIIYPSYVQGELAPRSLAGGVLFFNERCPVDTVIIGRGGGSAEDLWCFNDENLARVIADSKIPIVSAVGHETDFTICDFVSDVRAPTPSAAAELVFPDTVEVLGRINYLYSSANNQIKSKIGTLQGRLEVLSKNLELNSPEQALREKTNTVERAWERIEALLKANLDRKDNEFRMLCARLEGVNPLSVLAHGYSVVENSEGGIVTKVSDVKIGESVNIKLADGSLNATVTNKSNDRNV